MISNTGIEWTDGTWNPMSGCTKVSAGCANCYAESFANRKMGEWAKRPFSEIKLKDHKLVEPFRLKKPQRIFVNSMSDLFHKDVPDLFIDRVFAVMAMNPIHTFQVLTKRPERMRDYMLQLKTDGIHRLYESVRGLFHYKCHPGAIGPEDTIPSRLPIPLKNVWLGVSVENQKTADERIPILLETPCAKSFLSMEPLLLGVDLGNYLRAWSVYDPNMYDIGWVIVGGESGKGARPMNPIWARDIRDKCIEARVPFFYKQWGEWLGSNCNSFSEAANIKISKGVEIHNWPDGNQSFLVGKKIAGATIYGKEYKEFPA